MSDGGARLVWRYLLITGKEVTMLICSAENISTKEPTNIQNSRDHVFSSSFLPGISLYLSASNTMDGIKNAPIVNTSWPDIPMSVKEWTDESPKTPLFVRKVE